MTIGPMQAGRVAARRPSTITGYLLVVACSDRNRVRDALMSALPRIKPPRGPTRFDAYRQAITPIYITKSE